MNFLEARMRTSHKLQHALRSLELLFALV
jgi:hypothetical protein